MRLRFLGTGTSYGVPYIGCSCPVCVSSDSRDRRLRASILVEAPKPQGEGVTRLLVDTGPDFRRQCLEAGIDRLDAVLWTHTHNDHIIGLDDIRPLTDRQGYLPVYGDAATLEHLHLVFPYVFVAGRDHGGFPRATAHTVEAFQSLEFDAIKVRALPIFHGQRSIFAYEFAHQGRRIVYATDCSRIPSDSLEAMRGAQVFIVDALRHTSHPNHFNITQALEAIESVDPERAFFTHLTHDLGHAATEATLPERVRLAFDGLEIEV